jgi:hypothetical protein
MKKNENKGREMKTHDIINKTHKVGSIWKWNKVSKELSVRNKRNKSKNKCTVP